MRSTLYGENIFVLKLGVNKMNKGELIDAVASISKLSKTDSESAVNALFEAITQSLKQEDDVRIVGFGTFTAVAQKAREGRNPRTGEKLQIPASIQPKFRAGKSLKEALN